MFSGEPEAYGYFTFVSGTIVITYDVEVEDTTDPGHTFTFAANANSDALIATCIEGSTYHTCGLTNRQVTMPLVANDVPFDHYWHSASLDQTDFNSAGITDIAAILSYKDKSTNETLDNPPSAIGNFTVTATVTINSDNEHPYTLTKDFSIYNGVMTCNYPQFSFSPTPAIAGNDVTITFTPIAGETVTSLTLTGATTNMSIGSGITDNGNGTYTFTMVSESLTLGATLSEPDASHFEQTGTDEYTIKTANGWGWFCFTVSYGLAPNGYSGKTVVLTASVGSSEMAGTSGHPFKGTFDGQGNTLTFNLQAGEDYSAPFRYTDGATIKNFHVEGTITGGDNTSLGGLVGYATGNITIENCRVSTKISTTHSGAAWHGGVIALWYDSNVACTVTGCVYDGLIYNPSEADATTYCRGFIGNLFGSNLTVTFTDCLYAPAAYGTGEYAPGDNCYTFVYPNSSPTYNMTNCYYTTALGKRQGRPAATATDAPANLGDATTDHGLVKGYLNGFLYNGNYYTPKYGDAVVEYVFNALWEHADVTINGQGNNLVGVNITEEVGNVTSVTYNRTFTSGVAAAVILPFDYTCNGNEGGSFYSFAGVSGSAPVMESANEVTGMTANTPYLFVPTATAMTFPNISKMTDGVVTLKPTAGDHTVTSGDWTLTGIYAPKTWAGIEPDYENAFILNSIGKLNHIFIDEIVKPTDGYFVASVNTYTVTFAAGEGASGSMDPVTVLDGATYTLPDCTFTAPEGKTFFAWSVKIGDAEAVNKQPGDTITVTADTTVTALWTSDPSFKTVNLILSGEIGVQFFVDLDMLDNPTQAYVTFAISGKGTVNADPVYASEDNKNADGYYGFKCNVNALQMADTITATLHYGDNQTITKDYSVKAYVDAFMENTSGQPEATIKLVKALADYGHYVQIFLSNINGWTLGTDYAAMMENPYTGSYDVNAVKSAVAAYQLTAEEKKNGQAVTEGAVFNAPSMSLVLDSETAIRIFLANADGTKLNADDVTVSVTPPTGITWNAETQLMKTQKGNRVMVEIQGIKAAWLAETFTITATKGDNTQTINVSALSYVGKLLDSATYADNAAARNAVCALYAYAMAAKDFIN